MTGIQLVIFDMAGTVVDFGSAAPVAAFIEAFARRGVPVSDAETRAPMGTHKKDHIRRMLQTQPVAAKWRVATGNDWTEADVEALYRVVTPLQLEAAARHRELTPGLLDCVHQLKAKRIKIAAATGYFREAAETTFQGAARNGFTPDFTICADDVPAGRPAPWMIFRAMEALNVYPPAAVVKVGDTLIDIEDGKNAGAFSGAVVDSSSEMGLSEVEFDSLSPTEREARRHAVRERFLGAGADFVVDSLAELPGVIMGGK